MATDIAAARARIGALSEDEEPRFLEKLVEAGWSPGCWLRGVEDRIIVASPSEMVELLEGCAARKRMRPEHYEDPHAFGLPQTPIPGDDPAFVIVTQRCDIVSDLKSEPIVELVRAHRETNKGLIKQWYWGSTRYYPLEPETSPSYCVDLRVRYTMAKVDLDELPAAQALPDDHLVRTRFARRVGLRYSRAAVPEQAVAEIARPLHELLSQRPRANEILADVYLDPGETDDHRFGLLFVAEHDQDVQEADDLWEEVAAELRDRSALLDLDNEERNGVIAYDDFTLSRWERVSRIGEDEASYRSDDAAEPLI
jgi:hypothetical protein